MNSPEDQSPEPTPEPAPLPAPTADPAQASLPAPTADPAPASLPEPTADPQATPPAPREPQPVGTPLGGGPPNDPGPQGFRERALATVFLPEWAFRHHSATWGWLAPWLFVALLGLLAGVITLSSVDLTEVVKAQAEAGFDQLPAGQRAAMERPEAKDLIDKGLRMQAFGLKMWMIAGPFLGGLFGVVAFGGLLFVLARLLGGKGARVDLLRSMSVAAWLSLVGVFQYGASTLGMLSGNSTPFTSPQGLVSGAGSPLLHTVLSRLDPVTLLYYGLLSVALSESLRFERKRARVVAFGLYGAFSLLLIGFVGISVLLRGAAPG